MITTTDSPTTQNMKNTHINAFEGYYYTKEVEVNPESSVKKTILHNYYRGTDIGKGGYVYSVPGIYTWVALLDVASMHPHSMLALNNLGDEGTKRLRDLINIRLCIKHKDYESARKMFDGKMAKYLEDDSSAKQLSKALKLPINMIYGMTSASFDNVFRDPRNENNIVALRGALFMRTLQDEIQNLGYELLHIKTDSCKVANADQKLIDFVMEFGRKYSYEFEHEATYEKICLINKADYVAKYPNNEEHEFELSTGEKIMTPWTATGKQFQIPYVFKTLFAHKPINFKDKCETFQTKTALYLDMNEGLPEGEHNYVFVGKVGQFCPMKPGCGGGILYSKRDNGYNAAPGTKGFRWMESPTVKQLGLEDQIDTSYYETLVNNAIEEISKYGDFEWFVSDDPVPPVKETEDFMKIVEGAPEELPFI